jgi:hypothetical protein
MSWKLLPPLRCSRLQAITGEMWPKERRWLLLLVGGIIAILPCQTAVISVMALLLFVAAQRCLFSVVGEHPGELDREKANVLRWRFICAVLWDAVAIIIYSPLCAAVA